MKRILALCLVIVFILSMVACDGKTSKDNQIQEETIDEINWSTETQKLFPLGQDCTVTGIARLDNQLLLSGYGDKPVLGLVSYTGETAKEISFSKVKNLSLDEPEAVDESNIYGVCAGGDGFFYVLTGETPYSYLNETYQLTINPDYQGRYSILKYDKSGVFLDRMRINGWHGNSVQGIAVGYNGEIAIYGSAYVSVLSWGEEPINTEYAVENGFVQSVCLCEIGLVASFHEVSTVTGTYYLIDGITGVFTELEVQGEYDNFTVDTGNWTMSQGMNGEYVVGGESGSWFYVFDFNAGTETKLLEWKREQYKEDCIYVNRLSENTVACVLEDSNALYIVTAVQMENQERSSVKVALYGLGEGIKAELDALNALNNDYFYEYTSYDINQLELLQTVISTGEAPDLVLFTYDLLDKSKYLNTDSDYFEDLYPYIDSDLSMSRDSFLPNLLNALEYDGRVTQLWEYVDIYTISARVSDVGNGKELSPEDYIKILNENENYKSVFYSALGGKDFLLNWVATLSLSAYVDKENGICSFDDPSFAQLLRWANEVGIDEGNINSGATDMTELVAFFEQIATIIRIPAVKDNYGEPFVFVGFPMGKGAGHFYSFGSGVSMAIPTLGTNKAGAWAFIQNRLSTDRQYSAQANSTFPAVPVNYEALQRLSEDFLDEEEMAILLNLISETTLVENYADKSLYEIITTNGLAYFAGDKSLEETVELIQTRASMYMAEKYG